MSQKQIFCYSVISQEMANMNFCHLKCSCEASPPVTRAKETRAEGYPSVLCCDCFLSHQEREDIANSLYSELLQVCSVLIFYLL